MLESNSLIENTEFAGQLEQEKSKTFLDNLNLLYVSLTRPEERLYILSPTPPVKSGGLNSIPAFFRFFLKIMRNGLMRLYLMSLGNKTLYKENKSDDALPTGK